MVLDFTNLILLIGTNPLPNYIASKYFIEENKYLEKIWMICSEENQNINQTSTKKYALNLKELILKENASCGLMSDTLTDNTPANISKIECPEIIYIKNIGDRKTIEQQLEKIVENETNKKLHLFFTGGSKAMSVYSYYYLKEKFKNNFSASYLSARDFKIIFDNEENIGENRINKIKINFDDLIKLHGFNEKNTDKKNDDNSGFEEVIKKFCELIENDELNEYYCNTGGYSRDVFKPNIDNKIIKKIFNNIEKDDSDLLKIAKSDRSSEEIKEEIKNLADIKFKTDEEKNKYIDKFNTNVSILKKFLNFTPNKVFMKLIKSLPKENIIYCNNINDKSEFQTKIGYENYKKTVNFLDGFWLEQYVGKIIKENFKNNYDEILFNKEIYKNSDNIANNFELDVVLIKGCQLTGISCTTAKKKELCKTKGFEIILRTRQIGGSEAKAILITGADEENVNKIQSELILETGTVKKNILVIGKDDWKENKIKEKIQEFIIN